MDKTVKRAVGYCRVSTDSKDQANSFESQRQYFENLFDEIEDSTLVNIYADKGLSGTKLYRPQFDLMMQDAGLQRVTSKETNKAVDSYEIVSEPAFNYIYVTNISRFARNISADAFIKTLALNKVYVVYVDFHGNVYSTENSVGEKVIIDELVHAERFSRDLSAKVKVGMRQGAKKGNIYVGKKMYGYDYVRRNLDDNSKGNYLMINEAEAEVVRLIFDMYVHEGLGTEIISRKLAEQGHFALNGKQFKSNTIMGMLKNEKYCGVNNAMRYDTGEVFGDRRLKHIDYDDKTRAKAREKTAELKERDVVNRIPAIISVELFQKAQQIRESRKSYQTNKGRYMGKTDFAGLIVCGKCGAHYQAAGTDKDKDGNLKNRYYACSHKYRFDAENGILRCDNPTINEKRLDSLLDSYGYSLMRWMRRETLLRKGEKYRQQLLDSIDMDNEEEVNSLSRELSSIQSQKERLLDVYIEGKCTKEQYDNRRIPLSERESFLEQEIKRLSRTNEQIHSAIKELDSVLDEIRVENERFKTEAKDNKLRDKLTRKELLHDVEQIVIDEKGDPYITFKSLRQLERLLDDLYIGRESTLKASSF